MSHNTPPPPPVSARTNEQLLEDLLILLRRIAVLGSPPPGKAVDAMMNELKKIHSETMNRSMPLEDALADLSTATTWQMSDFLAQCLDYPKVKRPMVRLSLTEFAKHGVILKSSVLKKVKRRRILSSCLDQKRNTPYEERYRN